MKRSFKDIRENSPLYRQLRIEEDEINKHKWCESEKAGHDVGWDFAMIDWIIKFKPHYISGVASSGKRD